MPLPPYIRRIDGDDERDALDRVRYQTVFARKPGAIAAPTAGLHFSQELLDKATLSGHEIDYITLHVGAGTFAPIRSRTLDDHEMHEEVFEISSTTAARVNGCRAEGRPIMAVGTTTVRALEASTAAGETRPTRERTRLFIRPPYSFRAVDILMTNFHLPGSSLLALVAALIGLEEVHRVYRVAIEEEYRFFSYGDAMLVI